MKFLKKHFKKILCSKLTLLFLFIFFSVLVSLAGFLILDKIGFFLKSSGNIYLEEQSLKFRFAIDPKDRSQADEISKKLGINSSWQEGIDMVIDQKSAEYLGEYLPLEVKIGFNVKGIYFKSPKLTLLSQADLVSSLPNQTKMVATSGAELKLESFDGSAHHIVIKDPGKFKESVESEKIMISPLISGSLWSIADKLDTIDFKLSKNHLEGKVVLK